MSHATTPQTTGTVGLIGLGLVGMALAHRLQAAGLDVLGYDLREEARAIWAEDRKPLSVERSRALREIAKRQADVARNLAAEWNWAVRNFAEKEE